MTTCDQGERAQFAPHALPQNCNVMEPKRLDLVESAPFTARRKNGLPIDWDNEPFDDHGKRTTANSKANCQDANF